MVRIHTRAYTVMMMSSHNFLEKGLCVPNRVNGNLHGAIGAVFEPNRARQAAGQLAVHLKAEGEQIKIIPGNILRVLYRKKSKTQA